MLRALPVVAALAAFAAGQVSAETGKAYHATIQGDQPTTDPAEFARLEAAAYQRFDSAESYPALVRAFAASSERVWAIIYGEIFSNLTRNDERAAEIGALVFRLHDDAIEVVASDQTKISLSQRWTIRPDDPVPPFEANFELSILVSILAAGERARQEGLASPLEPLTIRALASGRAGQLEIWREKALPETELFRWQDRIREAGHFDAYNYWLFRAARAGEFEAWLGANRAAYEAWLGWRAANSFHPHVPDFHRLLLTAESPERELLDAGTALLGRKLVQEALSKSFDVVVRRFEEAHAADAGLVFCARSPEEAILYSAMAAAAGKNAVVVESTWADAFYLRAYALLELGRLAEARQTLERAVALSPQNAMYLNELAYTYQGEKNWDEAIARYLKAQAAAETYSPDDVKADELSRAMRGQGYALIELGKLDEAEAIYHKAIAANPEDRASLRELEYIEMMRAKQRGTGN